MLHRRIRAAVATAAVLSVAATTAATAATTAGHPQVQRHSVAAAVRWGGAAGHTLRLRHLVKLTRSGHGATKWDPFRNPHVSLKPKPDYNEVCYADGSMSVACFHAALQAINRARAREHVRPMRLPANYRSLSQANQAFVVTQAERVDRGLPPLAGSTTYLDGRATTAAKRNADPLLGGLIPGVLHWLGFVSNWAKDYNPLAADYDWMYDDGYPSGNYDCRRPGASGCWGHRENILSLIPGQHTIVGSSAMRLRNGIFQSLALIAVGVNGNPAVHQPPSRSLVTWRVTPPAGYRGWSMTWDHKAAPSRPQHTGLLRGFADPVNRRAGSHVVTLTVYDAHGRQTYISPRVRIHRHG